jgi:hypothetical protein
VTAPLEAQLEALGADLLALNEDEARKALSEIDDEISRLRRHAERLRVALKLRATWLQAASESPPDDQAETRLPEFAPAPEARNGKRPKTRDVLIATFRKEPTREFSTKELLGILVEHGITISAEGLRLALRRLIAEEVIFKPRDGRYQLVDDSRRPVLAT